MLKGEGRESTKFIIKDSTGLICHATSTAILHGKGYERLTPDLPSFGSLNVTVDELVNAKSRGGGTIEGITLEYLNESGDDDSLTEQDRLARCGIIMHYGIVVKDCKIDGFPQDGIRIDAQITDYGGSLFFRDLYETNGFINDSLHSDLEGTQSWTAYNTFSIAHTDTFSHTFQSRQLNDYTGVLNGPMFSDTDFENAITDFDHSVDADDKLHVSFGYNENLPAGTYIITFTYLVGDDLVNIRYYILLFDDTTNPQTHFPSLYTNANFWHVRNTLITQCGRHGLFTRGWDVNIGTALNVACTNNGTWGFSENSNLGNAYIGCLSKNNGVGSFLSGDSTSLVNDSVFIGCYGFKQKSKIKIPNIFWGGYCKPVPMNDNTPTPVINGEFGNMFSSKVFRAIDNHGPTFFNTKKNPLLAENPDSEETPPPIRVRFRPNFKEQGNVYYFDDFENGTGGNYRLNFSNDRFKFYHAASDTREIIHFLGATAIRDTGDGQASEIGAVQLEKGFFISENRRNDKRKVKVTSSNTLPVIEFPENVLNIIGTKGDILFNSQPEVGGHIGWICIKSAIINLPNIQEAVWKKIGSILT